MSASERYGGLTVEDAPRDVAAGFDLAPHLADWREDWRLAVEAGALLEQPTLWEPCWEADPCL